MARFVTIKSSDKLVNKLNSQIEKTFHLELWVMKAQALLDKYMKTLDENDKEQDPVKKGHLIQDLEVYFMSSVNIFLRCFLEQSNMRLNINEITTDKDLRACYHELMTLRNDEYVHWKGLRTNFSVQYEFMPVGTGEVEFAKNLQANYQEQIGPGDKVDLIKKLYDETILKIAAKRNLAVDKLRQHIFTSEEVCGGIELICNDGEVTRFKKNS